MFQYLDCRWALVCVWFLIFGLPSTLSSDARFEEGAYYEFGQEEEHSAKEVEAKPADAPPQPSFQHEIQKRLNYQEPVQKNEDPFNNRIPKNRIPRKSIPKSRIQKNAIEPSPIPRRSIEKSPIERNAIPKNRIEKNPIKKSPIPQKSIPKTAVSD